MPRMGKRPFCNGQWKTLHLLLDYTWLCWPFVASLCFFCHTKRLSWSFDLSVLCLSHARLHLHWSASPIIYGLMNSSDTLCMERCYKSHLVCNIVPCALLCAQTQYVHLFKSQNGRGDSRTTDNFRNK